jgi:3-oxoacyl-[acyl-carrier-protein] synthase II
LRRADRFARMAIVAAMDAWRAAADGSADISMDQVGLIVASGFGPHCRGFRFLDGILDCGDQDALPTDFSHSVHGAAASYIAETLELRGPSLSITDFDIGFEQAILLAQCWLAQGICHRVIVGVAEELGEVLIHCASRLLENDGRFVPGEGAVFMTLAPGNVTGIAPVDAAAEPRDTDLLMLDIPATPSRERLAAGISARCTCAFSPYFGHTSTSSAFGLLGGLLSLIADRPLGLILGSDRISAVDNAATLKPLWRSRSAFLFLEKSTHRRTL